MEESKLIIRCSEINCWHEKEQKCKLKYSLTLLLTLVLSTVKNIFTDTDCLHRPVNLLPYEDDMILRFPILHAHLIPVADTHGNTSSLPPLRCCVLTVRLLVKKLLVAYSWTTTDPDVVLASLQWPVEPEKDPIWLHWNDASGPCCVPWGTPTQPWLPSQMS